ncbi:MAG: hypothetical protein ACYDH3_05530, partial [Candidatus Aminicenantales bacterium]
RVILLYSTEMSPSACSICVRLGSEEKAFSVPGSSMDDLPLPTAAMRLKIVPSFDYEDKDRFHVRRCPACATFYAYRFESVNTTKGVEDEETLTRLSPAAAAYFLRRQARRLEAMRRDIDDTENASVALADFIEHGHPSPEEIRKIVDQMQSQRALVLHGRKRLHAQVEAYRRSCPEIVLVWAQAHRRACQYYVLSSENSAARPGFDIQTSRYVARTIIKAWESLPDGGETFISINTAFLVGYYERLRTELGKCRAARI